MNSKLLNRILVGIIFGPVTLVYFYAGGIFLQIFLGLLTLLMLLELRFNLKKNNYNIPALQIILGVFTYIALIHENDIYFLVAILLSVIILGGGYIFRNRSQSAVPNIAVGIFTIIYISFFLSMIFRLRILPQGRSIILSLLIAVWMTDTFAYFTGKLCGKHQGILAISPRKSLEGFLGGIAFGTFSCWLLVYVLDLPAEMFWMLSVSACIFGQFGDLFESLLKRDLKIKDSSRLMGEHGGVLDRFDSILLSAPALYVLISLFGV